MELPRKKAAASSPAACARRDRSGVGVVRIAAADRDRADANIAVKDVPAFLAGIGRSAAGEGRACPDDSAGRASAQIINPSGCGTAAKLPRCGATIHV